MELRIQGGKPLRGEVEVPADKSITHRALLLAALAEGTSSVVAPFAGEDNRSTARVLADLGVPLRARAGGWEVQGRGPRGFIEPTEPLDCGNSGTTIRLLTGILAGAGVRAEVTGDASLSRRPMGRVCKPLRALGVRVSGRVEGGRELPPVRLEGGALRTGSISLDVASAQVKSALLLAAVAAGRSVTVREPALSRDHTERMLRAVGASVASTSEPDGSITHALAAGASLSPAAWQVPGDFSSVAFLIGAGLLVRGSRIRVHRVGVNPTRIGLLSVLDAYGASIGVTEERGEGGEPVATLAIEPQPLRAGGSGAAPVVVGGATIPRLIDELVVLAAIASQVEGVTEVRDAQELRVKESDRIRETLRLLAAFGVQGEDRPDGFVVRGPQPLSPARLDVSGDHRLALTAAVLALAAPGESVLSGFDIAAVSYPSFVPTLVELGAELRAS